VAEAACNQGAGCHLRRKVNISIFYLESTEILAGSTLWQAMADSAFNFF
jgi:hypothetical protein